MDYTKKLNEEQFHHWVVYLIIFLSVVFVPSYIIAIDTPLIYGQTNQAISEIVGPLNIQDIPTKKVHVGDIDIAYKTFGRGDHILLISGSGNVMDVWLTHFLKELASNHTVIIFDNRGMGNTTAGKNHFLSVNLQTIPWDCWTL
jgi:hypothetical protein